MAWLSGRGAVCSDGPGLASIGPAGRSGGRGNDRPLADGLNAVGRLGVFSKTRPAGASSTEIG
jgi:hypothetical protein